MKGDYYIERINFKTDKKITYNMYKNDNVIIDFIKSGHFEGFTVTNIFNLFKDDNYIIFDVGANIGIISHPLGYKYKKSKIYAFEPSKEIYDLLCKNIYDNTIPVNLGLGNENKKCRLKYKDDNRGSAYISENGNEQINIIKLDDYINNNNINKLDIIKIDVEGFELEVIKGGINSILKYNPYIIIEIWDKKMNNFLMSEEYQILKKKGYNLFELCGHDHILEKQNINVYMTHKNITYIYNEKNLFNIFNKWNLLYNVYFYDDIDIFDIFKKYFNDDEIKNIKKLKNPVMKADIFRYLIIYLNGGIYTDCDNEPLNIRIMHRHKNILFLENNTHICQWIFKFEKQHKFLAICLDLIKERIKKVDYNNDHYVHYTTGPGLFTDALRLYLDNDFINCDDLQGKNYKNIYIATYEEFKINSKHHYYGQKENGWLWFNQQNKKIISN